MMASTSSMARVISRRALPSPTASSTRLYTTARSIGQQLHPQQQSRAPLQALLQRQSFASDYHYYYNYASHQRRTLSSSAALQEEEEPQPPQKAKPKRRRTLETKNPIIVTEKAAERINELLSGESAAGAIGIILGVKRRGCNGLSYTLNYAFEEPKDGGATMTAHGIRVFIEPMALFSIVGTKMDWEEDELTSEFTFNNPNSKGECGCGESFNV